jgi:hypothetical protein
MLSHQLPYWYLITLMFFDNLHVLNQRVNITSKADEPQSVSILLFYLTFLMAHSKANVKSYGGKSSSFRPFSIGNASNFELYGHYYRFN